MSLGDRIDGWRICWVGGWDKCRVLFVVMVEREYEQPAAPGNGRVLPAESSWLPEIDIALSARASHISLPGDVPLGYLSFSPALATRMRPRLRISTTLRPVRSSLSSS